jgi:hypothetical protein
MGSMSIASKPLAGLSLVALVALSAAACSQSEAATPRGPTTETAAAPAKGPKIDTEAYTVEMKATGKYKAGQEGTVEVTLVPKPPYKINDKYPIKFKLSDPAPEGVKFPKAVLKREDGTVDDKKALFKVPFIAEKAGKAKVSGVLYMSCCTDANCLMDKQEVEAVVDVE